jgi:hypothetical protein
MNKILINLHIFITVMHLYVHFYLFLFCRVIYLINILLYFVNLYVSKEKQFNYYQKNHIILLFINIDYLTIFMFLIFR